MFSRALHILNAPLLQLSPPRFQPRSWSLPHTRQPLCRPPQRLISRIAHHSRGPESGRPVSLLLLLLFLILLFLILLLLLLLILLLFYYYCQYYYNIIYNNYNYYYYWNYYHYHYHHHQHYHHHHYYYSNDTDNIRSSAIIRTLLVKRGRELATCPHKTKMLRKQ